LSEKFALGLALKNQSKMNNKNEDDMLDTQEAGNASRDYMSAYMNTRDLPSSAGGNNRLSVGFTEVSVNDLGVDSSIGDQDMVGIVVDERTSTIDYGDPRNDKRANKHYRSTMD